MSQSPSCLPFSSASIYFCKNKGHFLFFCKMHWRVTFIQFRYMQCTSLWCMAQLYFYIFRQPCSYHIGRETFLCPRSFLHAPYNSPFWNNFYSDFYKCRLVVSDNYFWEETSPYNVSTWISTVAFFFANKSYLTWQRGHNAYHHMHIGRRRLPFQGKEVTVDIWSHGPHSMWTWYAHRLSTLHTLEESSFLLFLSRDSIT